VKLSDQSLINENVLLIPKKKEKRKKEACTDAPEANSTKKA
jgi:hypothetical protein